MNNTTQRITFTRSKPGPRRSFLYQYGYVDAGPIHYWARRNRWTRSVQIKLYLSGWCTIRERYLFTKSKT